MVIIWRLSNIVLLLWYWFYWKYIIEFEGIYFEIYLLLLGVVTTLILVILLYRLKKEN